MIFLIRKPFLECQSWLSSINNDESEIYAEMLKRDIKTYIPHKDRDVKQTYTKEDFVYDAIRDVYIYPNNCLLTFSILRKRRGITQTKGQCLLSLHLIAFFGFKEILRKS